MDETMYRFNVYIVINNFFYDRASGIYTCRGMDDSNPTRISLRFQHLEKEELNVSLVEPNMSLVVYEKPDREGCPVLFHIQIRRDMTCEFNCESA